MKKEHRKYAPTVIPGKISPLPGGDAHDLYQEKSVQYHDRCRADKAPFFSQCGKNEIGMLFGHEIAFGLGTRQETLAPHAARTYRYLALESIEPTPLLSSTNLNAVSIPLPLVILEYIVPHVKM